MTSCSEPGCGLTFLRFNCVALIGSLLLVACTGKYSAPHQTITGCGEFIETVVANPDGKHFDRYGGAVSASNWRLARQFLEARPNKAIIVRNSDSGEFFNRCDFAAALYASRYRDLNSEKSKQSNLVVVYVHGWREDSGDGKKVFYNFSEQVASQTLPEFNQDAIREGETTGSDYDRFNDFIENLQNQVSESEHTSDHQTNVIGIFVSWEGGHRFPGLTYLTFWDRGAAANRIARSSSLSYLIGALENALRRQGTNSENQLVLIGHSFGGRILYSAVKDPLMRDIQHAYVDEAKVTNDDGSKECKRRLYDFVDRRKNLVVLINPAFEAGIYKQFDSLRYENTYQENQPPLLVTLTSDSDWPNARFFPLGQVVAGRTHRTIRLPMGSWTPYDTHSLCVASDPSCSFSGSPNSEIHESWYDNYCHGGVCLGRTPVKGEPKNLALSQLSTAENLNEPQIGNLVDSSPFLVVRADKELIGGHGWLEDYKPIDRDYATLTQWLASFIIDHSCQTSNSNYCQLGTTRTTRQFATDLSENCE